MGVPASGLGLDLSGEAENGPASTGFALARRSSGPGSTVEYAALGARAPVDRFRGRAPAVGAHARGAPVADRRVRRLAGLLDDLDRAPVFGGCEREGAVAGLSRFGHERPPVPVPGIRRVGLEGVGRGGCRRRGPGGSDHVPLSLRIGVASARTIGSRSGAGPAGARHDHPISVVEGGRENEEIRTWPFAISPPGFRVFQSVVSGRGVWRRSPARGIVSSVTDTRSEREMAQTPNAQRFPTRRDPRSPRPCGHVRHVGPCPSCQRAQLARWRAQLEQASRAGRNR
jgi:hypothetical protein